MRVLSPRIEPPETLDDGSTASTATRWPCAIRYRPSASMKVLLPTPGTPLMPRRKRPAGVRQQRVEQRVGARAVVGARRFEQRDGLGDGAALRGAARAQRRHRPEPDRPRLVVRDAVMRGVPAGRPRIEARQPGDGARAAPGRRRLHGGPVLVDGGDQPVIGAEHEVAKKRSAAGRRARRDITRPSRSIATSMTWIVQPSGSGR